MTNITYKPATLVDLPAMQRVGDDLFDYPIKPDRVREFLEDPRHHLILAWDGDHIVGMASGFHYIHPDKDPTLFVNEVAVLDNYQNQGIGREVVRQLLTYGQKFGCKEAWIATEQSNRPARKAFQAAGGVEQTELVVLLEFE